MNLTDKMNIIDRVSDFNNSSTADQIDKTEIQNNLKSEVDITKRSEDFIKNFKAKGYKPPTKNDWLPFILNSFYYIVLVLIVGIIGGNLNILSEGMHKTKNGNSGLENKLRKIFPHTQFAMDKLRIDESIDPYPQKVGKEEFPYDNWCSVCDLTVQLRLLFMHWPLKIFDASNYMMFTLLSSFITKYIKSSGVLKNFMIPILLGILIYLQLPVMISLIAALYSSTFHPHFLQYWVGIFVSWKYIKKYVKAFLKIITGLKNLSTGETPFDDRRVYYRKNEYLKDYYLTASEDEEKINKWSDNGENVTKIVDYLYKQEKELSKTSSDDDTLIDKILTSVKNKYSGGGHVNAPENVYKMLGKLAYPDRKEYKLARGDWYKDYNNKNFLVELWVFENVTRRYDDEFTTINDALAYHKKANKIIRNLDVGASIVDEQLDIIKTILRHVEASDELMNDEKFIRQKRRIKDGMWSWEEWTINTGLGSGSEETDSEEGEGYYIYKIAWKEEKRKQKKKIDKVRKRRQSRYDGIAWSALIICVIVQTMHYVINYGNATSKSSGSGSLFNSSCGGGNLSGGDPGGDSAATGDSPRDPSARRSSVSKTPNRGAGLNQLNGLAAKLGESRVADILFFIITLGGALSGLVRKIGMGLSRVTSAATCYSDMAATLVSLLKFIAIYFIFGWWVTPTYGLGICIAYALSTQLKIISLLMFSSLNKKYINATTDYLKNNRYGLTIMGLLMLSYSAMSYLQPNVAIGAFISLLVCSIIIICCL